MPPFPTILGPQHEQHILERHDEIQGPESGRDAADDVVGRQRNVAVVGIERFLGGIERAGANVAVDDAQCQQRKGRCGLASSRRRDGARPCRS